MRGTTWDAQKSVWEPFEPQTLFKDVEAAREIFVSLGFPPELAIRILDFAGYWYSRTTSATYKMVIWDPDPFPDSSAVAEYIRVPIHAVDGAYGCGPQIKHSDIREIEFNIVSHDQEGESLTARGMYPFAPLFL